MRRNVVARSGTIVIALLVASPAAGQERELSLADSIQLAQRHNFELQARGEEVRAARALKRQARGRFFPTVEILGRALRVNEVTPESLEPTGLPPGTEIAFGDPIDRLFWFRGRVRQPVFAGFGRIRARQAAGIGVAVEQRLRAETEADLVLLVNESYFGLYRARALTEVALASVRAVEAHLEQLRQLAAAGRATELDVSHGEARLAHARLQLVEARGAARVAAEALNTLLGLRRGTAVRLVDAPAEDPEALPAEARVTESALASRPELLSARRRADLGAAQVEVEKAAWSPVISVVVGYVVASPHERYPPPQEVFDQSWEVGVTASWTLDIGVTRNRVAEARHRAAAARHRVRALEDETSFEVQQRLTEIETAEQRVVAARRAAEAAERAFFHARQQFGAGRLDSAQLLDRELDRSQAQAGLLDARVEHTVARARLGRLLGAGVSRSR